MNIRNKMTLTFLLFECAGLLGIVCVVFELSMHIRIATAIIIALSCILVMRLSRCPSCNRYGIRIRPFAKENPSCKYCGKQL